MPTLQEIQRIYEQFVSSALENEYNKWQTNPNDLVPIIDKLTEMLNDYVQELKDEQYIP